VAAEEPDVVLSGVLHDRHVRPGAAARIVDLNHPGASVAAVDGDGPLAEVAAHDRRQPVVEDDGQLRADALPFKDFGDMQGRRILLEAARGPREHADGAGPDTPHGDHLGLAEHLPVRPVDAQPRQERAVGKQREEEGSRHT
jgi:hypothetical protein